MKKIFKQIIGLFGKEHVRKGVKEVKVDTNGEEHHLSQRLEAHKKSDRSLQAYCQERRYHTEADLYFYYLGIKAAAMVWMKTQESEETHQSTAQASWYSLQALPGPGKPAKSDTLVIQGRVGCFIPYTDPAER